LKSDEPAGRASGLKTIDGYIADIPYPSNFHSFLQPPWTDWNLERRGIRPPREESSVFTYVDLGCGDALGLIATAASHPQGRFVGVDAMPEHVDTGRRLIEATGVDNVTLHCADFATAAGFATGEADYVVAQGVLAWVSESARGALLDLAAAWLRPGGAFTVGYNAFPGWSEIAGLQRLLAALAKAERGSSIERFDKALATVREMGVFGPSVWEWLDPLRERLPAAYFAHEYLNGHWQPCWSSEVIAVLEERELDFVGQAGAARMREDLAYPAAWRDTLAGTPTASAREQAADLLAGTWYRQDVYVKGPHARLDEAEQQARVLARWWLLSEPADQVEFRHSSPAGTFAFDNPAARAIVAALGEGPRPLSAIADFAPADLINSIDALYAAGSAYPVDPPHADDVAAFNRRLAESGLAGAGIATRHGALPLDSTALAGLAEDDLRRLGIAAPGKFT
jgi:SAM-dependent methyltransferase